MQLFGRPGAQITLELEAWPVVLLRARGADFADEAISATIDAYVREVNTRSGPFGTVQDLRECTGLPPKQRAMLSEGMKRNEAINQRCIGHALVIASPLLRGMLTALLWLKKPEYEIAVFGDVASATEWLRGKVAKAA